MGNDAEASAKDFPPALRLEEYLFDAAIYHS